MCRKQGTLDQISTNLAVINGIELNTRFSSTDNGLYKINLFGPVSIYRPDGRHLAINTAKHAWLVVYLATRPGHIADRQAIAGLLWPSTTDKRSQDSFRTSLRNLRKALGDDAEQLFESANSQLLLRGDRIIIDVDQVETLINDETSHSVAQAIELVQSEIAEGLAVKEPEPTDWLNNTRARIRQRLLNLAERKLRDQETDAPGDASLIRYLSELCLRLDPTFDYGHFRLIEHYAAIGQTPLALKHYQNCKEVLARQLDAVPSQRIEDLVANIRREHSFSDRMPTSRDSSDSTAEPTIVDVINKPHLVLSRTVDREQASGGQQKTMNNVEGWLELALSKFRTFEISLEERSTVVGIHAQIKTSSQRFHLTYSIENNFSSQSIVLTLQERITGKTLWKEKFAVPDQEEPDQWDIFLTEVSNAIEAEIHQHSLGYRTLKRTAYDIWVEAETLTDSFHPDADSAAKHLLDSLATADVRYSRVYSSLASIYLKKRLFHPEAIHDKTVLNEAMKLANYALALDNRDAVNQQTMGWLLYQTGNFDKGKRYFEKALTLNPYSAQVNMACAEAFAYAGDAGRASDLADKAFKYTLAPPLYFYGYLATIYFTLSDYAKCIEMCNVGPSSLETQILKAAALACLVRQDDAKDVIKTVISTAQTAWGNNRPMQNHDIGEWLSNITMFAEPQTRMRYFDALQAGGLELPATPPTQSLPFQ